MQTQFSILQFTVTIYCNQDKSIEFFLLWLTIYCITKWQAFRASYASGCIVLNILGLWIINGLKALSRPCVYRYPASINFICGFVRIIGRFVSLHFKWDIISSIAVLTLQYYIILFITYYINYYIFVSLQKSHYVALLYYIWKLYKKAE